MIDLQSRETATESAMNQVLNCKKTHDLKKNDLTRSVSAVILSTTMRASFDSSPSSLRALPIIGLVLIGLILEAGPP
jgi:hypothetical protein